MDSQIPFPREIWEHIPPEAQVYIRALESRVAALEATVQQLREQAAADLAHLVAPTVERSAPGLGPTAAARAQGRRPGGQPGHEGQARALVPVEAVDVVIPVKPERCHRCQHLLQGEDPQPQRHQVTEIPPVQPVVTEYQLHRLVCPACGEATRAEVPAGVPTGGFGPRVQAITALCTGAYHLSKRTTQSVLEDLFGVSMGLGTVANLEQATVQAVAEPVAEARAYVQAQPAAYLDETGWREGQQRAWLWTAVTSVGHRVCGSRSRGGKVAQELLGERFWGWLVTDRWSAYTWYPTWRRQVCWAHLLRDIEAMIERGGRSQEIGEALQAQARQMFHWWHRVRDGTLAHRDLCQLYVARPAGSGAAAGSRPNLWGAQDGGHLPGDPQAAAGPVDVRAARRGGAHEQRRRAGDSARGPLAQGQLWDPERGRLPLCRSDDDGGGHAEAATSPCPRLCHSCL